LQRQYANGLIETPEANASISEHKENAEMRYLHTMVRVSDLDKALDFYCAKLGLQEVRRIDSQAGRFTLVFLSAPGDVARAAQDQAPLVELTYNWDPETYTGGRNFGHLAYRVDNIYAVCQRLMDGGVTINRPPRDGHMAFVRSPDGISIELLQDGAARPPEEPWTSMPNTGSW
jgi:lactoylglutathione lyase